MPKSKRAPALFELIGSRGDNKSADPLAVPKWLKTAPPPGAKPPAQREPAPPPQAPAARKPGPGDDTPTAAVNTGRIQLSLNPTTVLVAAGVLSIALLCVYLIGRGIGSKAAGPAQLAGGTERVDTVASALHQPADGQVLDPSQHPTPLIGTRSPARTEVGSPAMPDKARAENATAAPAAAGPARPAAAGGGPNHIVVERFKAEDRKSAEHVQKWLAGSGLETFLMTDANNRIWLVTVEGYNLEDPEQKDYCNRLVDALKAAGEDCRRELLKNNLTPYLLKGPEIRRIEK